MIDKEQGGIDNKTGEVQSLNIHIEIIILAIAISANIVTTFLMIYLDTRSSPYVTMVQLQIAQIVEVFIIGLAALGLIYKSIWVHHVYKRSQHIITELKNLSEVRETFIHMAQHRLRTPLSGVRWAIGALKTSPHLDDQERDMVEKSAQKMEIAESLVEKMMKLHKSDLTDFEMSEKKDSIDLALLMKEIISDLDYLASGKKTEVIFDPKVQITIDGDRYLLKSSLTNVVDNSIRYSPEGRVEITLESANPGAKITVADNGVGISPEDLEHIFERFYRGKNAQAIDPNQSGIGMYLTKQVIGLHGGDVEVESQEGEGTTFTITLPKE